MQIEEYQRLAMRTNDGRCTERLEAWRRVETGVLYKGDVVEREEVDAGGLLNGCLGLAGEAGETLDIVKKWVFHGKEIDIDHFEKELGDVMWYMAMICQSTGLQLEIVMEKNIEKLKKRYPDGFDTQRANNRSSDDI